MGRPHGSVRCPTPSLPAGLLQPGDKRSVVRRPGRDAGVMAPSMTRRLAAALLVWLALVPGPAAASPAGGGPSTSDGPLTADTDPPPALRTAARPLHPTEPSGPLEALPPSGRRSATPGWSVSARPPTVPTTSSPSGIVPSGTWSSERASAPSSWRPAVLEAHRSTGARPDHHPLTGRGDPVPIMSEEFRNAYLLLHSQEYLDMIRRMRAHDVPHPDLLPVVTAL